MRTAFSAVGLFAALSLVAGCGTNGTATSRSGMAVPTRGGAGEALPTTATGQSAVTNPSMNSRVGINRPYGMGSDPNMPANTGDNQGVQGKPSGTGP